MEIKQVEMTDQEIVALKELLDAGVRHLGLPSVHNASFFLHKFDSAKPKPTEPDAEQQ